MPSEHWMVFGTFAQQNFFEYPHKGNTYEGVILNANMVAHAPAGIAAFLQEKRAGNKYLIDPMTHAFQHSPSAVINEDGEPKSSIKALADHYGEPLSKMVGIEPLLPMHLTDPVLESLVLNCVRFQREYLPQAMAKTNAAKYLLEEALIMPHAVVAPYFYLTEATLDGWLGCCVRAAVQTKNVVKDASRVFAYLVISQGVLVDPESRGQILEAFSDCNVDGFLLWVDDLDEQVAGKQELLGLLKLSQGLRQDGRREVINVHGGYFSVLASGAAGDHAMSGVAHGPEFGEYRSVVPVGGGIPIARYYIPRLHARVRYREAARMFKAQQWLETASKFHENVCGCDECVATLAGDSTRFALFGEGRAKTVKRGRGLVRIEFPTRETTVRCLRHYLQNKHQEYTQAARAPKEQLLKELDLGIADFEKVAGLEGVAHLRLWAKVLRAG
jgi:hypothetical protein